MERSRSSLLHAFDFPNVTMHALAQGRDKVIHLLGLSFSLNQHSSIVEIPHIARDFKLTRYLHGSVAETYALNMAGKMSRHVEHRCDHCRQRGKKKMISKGMPWVNFNL